MDRRSFLQGVGILGLSQVLAGCNGSNRETLKVRLLKNSIPPQILSKFRRSLQQPAQLDFAPEPQLGQLFELLQNWKRQAEQTQPDANPLLPFQARQDQRGKTGVPDLVTMGDYWLAQAIQQNLIQPLNPQRVAAWPQVPAAWQRLVTRDRQGQASSQGQVWGMPYRWGTTVIAYRTDKFAEQGWAPPTDWSDLWRPELRDRISLLDQPREVIGLTLKKLNRSYNTANLAEVPTLKSELQALHQQVRLYSSTNYLQPLILGDTWLAVGWSTDVISLINNNRPIAAVVPRLGTRLWTDVWVRPAVANLSADPSSGQASLLDQWLDFCLQPQTAIQLSILSEASSPTIVGLDRATLPTALTKEPLLLPEPSVIEQSEFLYPLSQQAIEQYQALWLEVRLTPSRG
ncbi:MAG TPA: extracellular solute-binding protein [Candidatus Obscuribacterales bacterium]